MNRRFRTAGGMAPVCDFEVPEAPHEPRNADFQVGPLAGLKTGATVRLLAPSHEPCEGGESQDAAPDRFAVPETHAHKKGGRGLLPGRVTMETL